jgi:hypothetical protein
VSGLRIFLAWQRDFTLWRWAVQNQRIKVKIASEDRETKALIVEAIVRETGACNVQVIGSFTQSCVGIEDILSVAARFYALALGGTEPAFYR